MEERLLKMIVMALTDRITLMVELTDREDLEYNKAYCMGMISTMHMAGIIDDEGYVDYHRKITDLCNLCMEDN